MFHNVYMQPWAYREFLETGQFPEQTMFVLTFYEASRKSAPARAGFCEGDRQPGYEVHTKKEGIDPSGWAFFAFAGGTAVGQKLPVPVECIHHVVRGVAQSRFSSSNGKNGLPPLLARSPFSFRSRKDHSATTTRAA